MGKRIGGTGPSFWEQRSPAAGRSRATTRGARTKSNEAEGELRSDNVHQLTRAWDAYTSGTNVNAPISVGDVIYVTTDSGRAAAFDAGSGAIRWQRNFDDGQVAAAPVFGNPAWHGGELLVPAMFQGKGGLLRLDSADGAIVGGGLTLRPHVR